MNNSDETLKKVPKDDAVLQAVADLSKIIGGISDELKNLSGRFDKLEAGFDRLENRFDNLEIKFGKLEGKFDNLESRFDKLEGRFDRLENRFDKLERFVTVQFDLVQEGIAYHSAKFDRMEAKFFDVRSDVSNMRADLKELNQAVRRKELV